MRWPRAVFACTLAAGLLAACATAPPPAAPAAPSSPDVPPRDESTATAIQRALQGEHRSAESRAHDAQRQPLETLLFFGIKPQMVVVETWPGADGWYTGILAPLLAERGRLYTALQPSNPDHAYIRAGLERFRANLMALPAVYGGVQVTSLGPGDFDIAPAGSADMVLSYCNLHAWMNLGYAPEALASLHRALKPGGILGIVGHRADPSRPPDPRATNGYVNEEYAVRLIESAGFELAARAEINANPRDTRDHEQGVWALPPFYRAGKREREKYDAIGESDRFTLKFKKR
jgi:predicted methyltransferase